MALACLSLVALKLPFYLNAQDSLYPFALTMIDLAAFFAYVPIKHKTHWPLSIALFCNYVFFVALEQTISPIALFVLTMLSLINVGSFFHWRISIPLNAALIAGLLGLLGINTFSFIEIAALCLIFIFTATIRELLIETGVINSQLKQLHGEKDHLKDRLQLLQTSTNLHFFDLNWVTNSVDVSSGLSNFVSPTIQTPESFLSWWKSHLDINGLTQFESSIQRSIRIHSPVTIEIKVNLTGVEQIFKATVLAFKDGLSDDGLEKLKHSRILLSLQDQADARCYQEIIKRDEAIIKSFKQTLELRLVYGHVHRRNATWEHVVGDCEELFGYPAEYWKGQPIIYDMEDWVEKNAKNHSDVFNAIKAGHSLVQNFQYSHPKTHQIVNIACCLWQDLEHPDLMECTLIDMTAISLRDKQIHQLNESLNIAESATSEFLSSLNHELMTPMNSLASYIQVAFANSSDQLVRGHLSSAMNSIRQLKSMVSDAVSMGEMHMVHMRPVIKPFSLGQMITSLKQGVETRLQGRQVVFNLQVDNRLSDQIQADQARMKQIMLRLLSYATTFTRRGSVSLTVKQGDVDFNLGTIDIIFVIKDQSRGIAKDNLKRVNSPKLELLESQKEGFVHDQGMTLMLAQQHTKYLNGTFEVESVSGIGNIFTVMFPVEIMRSPDAKTAAEVVALGPIEDNAPDVSDRAERLHGKKLLIVDDNPLNNESLKLLLELEGAEVTDLLSPIKALELIEKNEVPFCAIILDVQMPELNGFELAAKIRKLTDWQSTPIIFISANFDKALDKKCQQVGGNLILSKPFKRDQLVLPLLEMIESSILNFYPSKEPSEELIVDIAPETQKILGITEESSPQNHSEHILDVPKALENLGGNTKIYEKMLSRFMARIDSDSLEFKNFIINKDVKQAAAKAHFIAGSAAIIGATKLSSWLKNFENRCITDPSFLPDGDEIDQYEQFLKQLLSATKHEIDD